MALCALRACEPTPEFYSWVSGCELGRQRADRVVRLILLSGALYAVDFFGRRSTFELWMPTCRFVLEVQSFKLSSAREIVVDGKLKFCFFCWFYWTTWKIQWKWTLALSSPGCSSTWLLALKVTAFLKCCGKCYLKVWGLALCWGRLSGFWLAWVISKSAVHLAEAVACLLSPALGSIFLWKLRPCSRGVTGHHL